jgi:ABC-2 type transport system ATP-binding protein
VTAVSAIQVQALHKSYGRHEALRGIDFEVEAGEIVGFLGPNGAGKSTAMKILTGFLSPSSGTARIFGHEVITDPIPARRKMGYLPENAPIYPDMRVQDYLRFVARIRGLGRAEQVTSITRTAHQCGLEDRLEQSIGSLSKGYRQRVGLAQALIHSPEILILDEPTTGLDPNQIVEIRNLIRTLGQTRTVVLSTHILSEVRATCDRVIIIHQGRIVADGSTDDVASSSDGGQLLQVEIAPGNVALGPEALLEWVRSIEGVEEITLQQSAHPEHHQMEILANRDVRAEIHKLATDQGLVLLEISRAASSLEEVFRRLTSA